MMEANVTTILLRPAQLHGTADDDEQLYETTIILRLSAVRF